MRQARAAYDAAVANYRQTVLTAFQQVEDELATLRILEQQDAVQEQATRSANLAAQLTLNQYKAGTVAYTAVVTAQTIALSDAQTLLTIRQSRLTASVALIQALGGGWNASSLGTARAPLRNSQRGRHVPENQFVTVCSDARGTHGPKRCGSRGAKCMIGWRAEPERSEHCKAAAGRTGQRAVRWHVFH